MDTSGASVRSVIVTRDFSTGPPDQFFATHVAQAPISIQGHDGVIEFPPAAPYTATRIAWKPLSNITITVFGLALSKDEVQAIAQGVVYRRGGYAPKPTPADVPCDPKPLILGALSRPDVVTKVNARAAKLVRVTDLAPVASDLLSCTTWSCDPPLVVWLVAVPATGVDAPTGVPPGSATTIEALDAATGRSRGGRETRPTGLPSWWDTLQDYAP